MLTLEKNVLCILQNFIHYFNADLGLSLDLKYNTSAYFTFTVVQLYIVEIGVENGFAKYVCAVKSLCYK
jgi:hypothetical protein